MSVPEHPVEEGRDYTDMSDLVAFAESFPLAGREGVASPAVSETSPESPAVIAMKAAIADLISRLEFERSDRSATTDLYDAEIAKVRDCKDDLLDIARSHGPSIGRIDEELVIDLVGLIADCRDAGLDYKTGLPSVELHSILG